MKRKSFIQIETRAGEPMLIGDQEIVLQARALSIQLPGVGGVVWNRPTAVIARARDGRAQKIIVRDVTRLAQLLVIAFGVAVMIALSRMQTALRANERG